MTTQQAIDIAKVQAFMGKVMADNASTAATVMAALGTASASSKHWPRDRQPALNWRSARISMIDTQRVAQ